VVNTYAGVRESGHCALACALMSSAVLAIRSSRYAEDHVGTSSLSSNYKLSILFLSTNSRKPQTWVFLCHPSIVFIDEMKTYLI